MLAWFTRAIDRIANTRYAQGPYTTEGAIVAGLNQLRDLRLRLGTDADFYRAMLEDSTLLARLGSDRALQYGWAYMNDYYTIPLLTGGQPE